MFASTRILLSPPLKNVLKSLHEYASAPWRARRKPVEVILEKSIINGEEECRSRILL